MKYYIVPVVDIVDEIECTNANEAMEKFAFTMDLDMNAYFKAMTEEEYKWYRIKKDAEASKRQIIEFYFDELIGQFDFKEDDPSIKEIAEDAYDRYCEGNGETEYECLEWALDKFYNIL